MVPGIQLADLFAGMARKALETPNAEPGLSWRGPVWKLMLPTSMEADLDYADIQQPMPLANAIVLKELAHRASLGRDCLAGMEEYYAIVRNRTGAGSRGERMRP